MLTVNDLMGLDYERLRSPTTPMQDRGIGTIPQQNFYTYYPTQNYGTTDYVSQNLNNYTPTSIDQLGIAPVLKSSIPNNLLYEDMNYKFIPDAYGQSEDVQTQKTQTRKKINPQGLVKLLMSALVPGSGLLMSVLSNTGIQRKLSDFKQATSLMDYLDMQKYGGLQGRRDAAARTMAQARGLQKQIDQRESAKRSNSDDRGMGQITSTPSAPRSTKSGISSSERGRSLHG